jgi:hypothetical protein
MARILVLDDDKLRHASFARRFEGHEVAHVFDPYEAVEKMIAEKWDLVHLDHDLGWFEYNPYKMEVSGTEVVRMMVDRILPENRPDQVIVHSWNPDGARRMVEILREAGFTVSQEMFMNDRTDQGTFYIGQTLHEPSGRCSACDEGFPKPSTECDNITCKGLMHASRFETMKWRVILFKCDGCGFEREQELF